MSKQHVTISRNFRSEQSCASKTKSKRQIIGYLSHNSVLLSKCISDDDSRVFSNLRMIHVESLDFF
jgi:hypothetical protein